MAGAEASRALHCIAVKAAVVVKVSQHPREDYEELGTTHKGWVGLHRRKVMRQLVVVQRVNPGAFGLMARLTQIAHLNIARPLALYQHEGQDFVSYEFLDLDLFDVLPLYQVEVAAVMLQVMDATHHLLAQCFAFRLDTIRVSAAGVVKIGKFAASGAVPC